MSRLPLHQTQTPSAPGHILPAVELAARARAEAAGLRRHEPNNNRYGLKLFRRAILAEDDGCWTELAGLYHNHVVRWCQRSGATAADDLDALEALTWERFRRRYTPRKLSSAAGLPAVVLYLKLCAHSVVVDRVRASDLGRARPAPPSVDASLDLAGRRAFRQSIEGHLLDEAEHVLVHLMYIAGMDPGEVQAQRPDLFPTVSEVDRLTCSILDRLRRSAEFGDAVR